MYESKDEMVSHPQHYIRGGMETIDVITAFTEGLEGVEAYDTGAILKYICRWKQKGGAQDLEKAMWYTQHLIDHVRSIPTESEERAIEAFTAMCKRINEARAKKQSDAEKLRTVKVITETAEEAEAGREYVDEVVRGSETATFVKGTNGYWRIVRSGDSGVVESITKEQEADNETD